MLPGTERDVLRLRRRLWPGTVARIDDFTLGEEVAIDFRKIWTRHLSELSPFCIDVNRNQVVFVRVASDVVLTAAPFYYQAQRQHAIKVYSLGFRQFYELGEELDDDPGNVGFLFSTGRCGSTLLGSLLAASPDIVTTLEPDIYTQAVISELPSGDAAKIVRYTTRVLSAIHRHRSPSVSFVLIKLRSQCVYRGDLFQRSDHHYRKLFLYRNATDVVNSFYAMLPSWLRIVLRHVPIDHWVLSGARAEPGLSRICPLVSAEQFSALPRSCFNICVLMWLSAMQSASRLQAGDEPFFETILRYEDLVTQRQDAVLPLFEKWRITPPGIEAIEDVFVRNSQSGSHIESRGMRVINHEDEKKLRSIIAMHSHIHTPEYTFNAWRDQSR